MDTIINNAFGVFFFVLFLAALPIVYHFGKALYVLAHTWAYEISKWSSDVYTKDKKDK